MIKGKRYEASWESLAQWEVPKWYLDAKFGIFIHWGVYSVPAFGNEWYPRNMYRQGTPEFEHHVTTYGPQSEFGYKDFIPMFGGERFDAREWIALFSEAGARYVVPVAEHHDGFAMYATERSRWHAARMGPRRDVVGEIAEAARERGLVFGLSSHRAEHWWFFHPGTEFDSDVRDPAYADLYGPAQPEDTQPNEEFLEDWLARCIELVDRYRPQLFWFDWWIEQPAFKQYLQRFAAHYYNRGEEWGLGVAINYKHDAFPPGTAVLDIERGQLGDLKPFFWQTDTSISNNSWGYVQQQEYKTPTHIIGDLVDIVSKNGALLLNVGPKPDGTIPEREQEILREIGRWLQVNGEAIYETRPWRRYGEGPTQVVEGQFSDTKRRPFTAQDVRFTTRPGRLYAILLGWPEGEAVISTLEPKELPTERIVRVELLGSTGDLKWTQDDAGLRVWMPSHRPCNHAYALRITLREG